MTHSSVNPIETSLTLDGRIVLECVHADTCLSDYWPGHHLPHIQVPVYKNMTTGELRVALFDELVFNENVMGSCDAARLMRGYDVVESEKELADQLIKAAKAAIRRVKSVKGVKYPFSRLESETEESDTVYAYFVFRDKQ